MAYSEEKVDIYVEVMREGVGLPAYANAWDAGMDVCAATDMVIRPGQTVIVPTGLKMAIPEGFEIQVRPRSGLSLKTPLRLPNSPGTIDAGYRDEIGIIITNTSPCDGASSEENNEEPYTLDRKDNKKGSYLIRKGDRIAQLVLCRVPRIAFHTVESVRDLGTNRGGGFGSSGIKSGKEG